jgi:hypothetical protein
MEEIAFAVIAHHQLVDLRISCRSRFQKSVHGPAVSSQFAIACCRPSFGGSHQRLVALSLFFAD